jgi:hypothetical protein
VVKKKKKEKKRKEEKGSGSNIVSLIRSFSDICRVGYSRIRF